MNPESGFKKRDLKLGAHLDLEEVKTSDNPNEKIENIIPESFDAPSISSAHLQLIEEIKQECIKELFKNSKIIQDIICIFQGLENFKNIGSDKFINLNYLVLFHLESKQMLNLAEKLKQEIEKFEFSSQKVPIKQPNNSNAASNVKSSIFQYLNRNCGDVNLIKKIILFLSTDKFFSFRFKEKTLSILSYDVKIFNQFQQREKFTEKLLENDVRFFDQVLRNCKNSNLLKYYEYEESIGSVVQNFYDFIDRKKLIDIVIQGAPNEDIIINTKILEFCFKNNLNAIIDYILDTKKHILLMPNTIFLSFQYQNYDHLKKYLKLTKLLMNMTTYNIIIEIFKLKNEQKTFLDFLLFIYALKDQDFKNETWKYIYVESKNMISNSKEITSIIFHMNPLFIFVTFAQIFFRFSKKSDNFHYAFMEMGKKILNKCKEFIDNYSDYDHLQILVSNSYAPLNKSTLDIIFEDSDFFFPFFSEKRISTIVRTNLDNGIIFDFDLMAKSTIFKIFRENIDLPHLAIDQNTPDKTFPDGPITKYKIYNILTSEDEERINIFQSVFYLSKQVEETDHIKKNHFYERKTFFGSITLRVLLDFIAFFALFIYILFFTRNYTNTNYFFVNVDQNYKDFLAGGNYTDAFMESLRELSFNGTFDNKTLSDLKINYQPSDYSCLDYLYNNTNYSAALTVELLSDCETFDRLSQDYHDLNNNLKTLFIILLVISGDIFLRKGYQIFILQLKFFSAMDLFELLNMFACFVILIIFSEYFPNTHNLSQYFLPDNFIRVKNGIGLLNLFFGFFMFFLWLKIALYVKFWSKFSFIIKTIELMVRATSVFMVVYFINIAAFCSVLYVIYSDYTDFNTFMKGMRNLFGYSLGQFSFPDESSPVFQVLIAVILITFLVISNVVLLNLLVAILTNVFNALTSRIDLENAKNNFMLQKQYFFDVTYGHLIFFPRSFNFLLIPIHGLALAIASPQFTLLIINIYFGIYFLILFSAYITLSFAAIPLAWLKILWLIYANQYFENCDQKMISVATRSVHFIFWFFGGLPYLMIIIIFIDIPRFVKSSWNEIIMPSKPMMHFQKIMQRHIFNILDEFKGNPEKIEKNVKAQAIKKVDEEKLKHENLREKLKKKIYSKKATLHEKKKVEWGGKDVAELERICGGIEYYEAMKIFNFSSYSENSDK